jgi:DHA1 family bicyclomycin/chloramphenicol resistance-like MFS transporter
MHLTPIQLGLFFAGTVLIVFAAGMLATRLAPRYGLDRSIRGGLVAAVTGSIAMLLVALYSPHPPFLSGRAPACSCSAWASSIRWERRRRFPRSATKAGAASALVGFWQMMTAAIGVWLAATISHEALFALGMVLTVFSLAAVGLYTLRAQSPLGPHEHEVGVGIAIVGDEAEFGLNVRRRPDSQDIS